MCTATGHDPQAICPLKKKSRSARHRFRLISCHHFSFFLSHSFFVFSHKKRIVLTMRSVTSIVRDFSVFVFRVFFLRDYIVPFFPSSFSFSVIFYFRHCFGFFPFSFRDFAVVVFGDFFGACCLLSFCYRLFCFA